MKPETQKATRDTATQERHTPAIAESATSPPRTLEGTTRRWRWHLGPDFPRLDSALSEVQDGVGPTDEALRQAEERLTNYDPIPDWAPRAGRRNLRAKLWAGLSGFKHAIRGDSSFFAHAYRALLVTLTAAMLGLPAIQWIPLVFGFSLVILAELAHSAIDTLARAVGDPEEPRLKSVRDIAAAMVLTAVVGSATISVIVLTVRFISVLE